MSADPAYQAWRGQKLFLDGLNQEQLAKDSLWAAVQCNNLAAEILNPARPVRQPDFAALGLGSADEAAGRN